MTLLICPFDNLYVHITPEIFASMLLALQVFATEEAAVVVVAVVVVVKNLAVTVTVVVVVELVVMCTYCLLVI